jgi:hypothetical protein
MKPSWSRATANQKQGPEGDGVLKSSVKAAATPTERHQRLPWRPLQANLPMWSDY